jgi:perosamine synthetase
MPEVLNCQGEGTIFLGRRPDKLRALVHPRRLATNYGPPYKFAYARTALKYGLMTAGFQPGDHLLVPDLICESLLEPLGELGIEVVYYPVCPTLEPEWHRLEELLNPQARALVVVHYFGQPQILPDCLAFCRRHGLLLIEDNAHGFGGTFEGQLLGTFGAFGVSSPRKSFPVKNGALLYLADNKRLELTGSRLQPSASISPFKKYCKQWLQRLTPPSVLKRRQEIIEQRRRLGPPPPYGSQAAFRDPPLAHDYGMDAGVDVFLARQDLAAVGKARRRIYHIWHKWAEAQGLRPVFPTLAPGAMPLVFPAYARSFADSMQWYERGHRAGVDIHSWPTLPTAIVQRDGGAMRLWERLVCFPIHQEMDAGVLERRLAALYLSDSEFLRRLA